MKKPLTTGCSAEQGRCIFWNCYGFRNFRDIFEVVKRSDIVCLYETWLLSSVIHIPGNSFNFDYINVQAKKISHFGRASGGILVLYNKRNFLVKELLKCDEFIFMKVNYNNVIFILGVAYRSPLVNFSSFLDSLKASLIKVANDFPDYPFILGGGLQL